MRFEKLFIAAVALAGTSQLAVADMNYKTAKMGGEVSLGVFQSTQAANERGYDLSGRAMILRGRDGSTQAYAHVLGLTANQSYGTHVHNLPCDLGGGGHYKIDPNVSGAVLENEIWPVVNVDAGGVGSGYASVDHIARPEAQSIVIHDSDGARIACADVVKDYDGAIVTKGKIETTEAGEELGLELEGLAQMERSHQRTYVSLRVSGLAADTTYGTHVHDLPCDVNAGGGHYKIDPSVDGAILENEIWPIVSTDAEGNGTGSADVAHLARPEAQSVVIHNGDGTRIACADLKDKRGTRGVTKGQFLSTATAIDRGFEISGKAKMIRKFNGKTDVSLSVKGLDSFSNYTAHVHNKPCRLGGGSHYMIDPSIDGVYEDNELWLHIATNSKGRDSAKTMAKHLARPDAQSIVIHGQDGARLACSDLD